MKITYKGVEYISKEDLYKKHNVTRKAIEYRLSKGMTLEEALNYDGYGSRTVKHDGEKYRSIRELADKKNISINTVQGRLKRGLKLDEAVTQERYTDRVRIKHINKTYDSMLDFASEFGLDYRILGKVVKSYGDNDIIDGVELINNIQNRNTTSKVTLWYRTYTSYKDLAKSFGLDYGLFMFKLTKDNNNTGLDKVVLEMLNSGIIYKGVRYKGLADLCSNLGNGYSMTHARIIRGWSLEDAIETPKDLSRKRKSIIKYRGIGYNSKEELCLDYDFSTTFVRSVSNRIGRDLFYTLDILIEFFGNLDCEKPPIISRPPYNIYNGLWCAMEKDFCEACNIDLNKFRDAKGNLTENSSLDYMRKYTEVKVYKYYFKGKEIKRSNLEVEAKKNGLSLKDFVNLSEFRKEEKLKHPESTFKETGFCHNTLQEFNKYIEKHKIEKG